MSWWRASRFRCNKRDRKARPDHSGRAFHPTLSNKLAADRLQVHRRKFAAAVDLDLELQAVALVDGRKAGALHSRNMDEGVGLAIVAADEAEAFHRVEEFDGAARLFAGQLTLRPAVAAAAVFRPRGADDFHWLAVNLEVGG